MREEREVTTDRGGMCESNELITNQREISPFQTFLKYINCLSKGQEIITTIVVIATIVCITGHGIGN